MKHMQAASTAIDQVASLGGSSIADRKTALAQISKRVDQQYSRLHDEQKRQNAALNPVSQREGD